MVGHQTDTCLWNDEKLETFTMPYKQVSFRETGSTVWKIGPYKRVRSITERLLQRSQVARKQPVGRKKLGIKRVTNCRVAKATVAETASN